MALVLLVPVIVLAAGLTAIVIAPPFIGASYVVKEVDRRLTAAGADFTRIPRFPERSDIYARDAKTLLATVYLDNRELVALDDVSLPARQAVLAIEDSGFYEHGPLNYSSLARAVIENLKAGQVVQGGSTLTQQLVKNTLGLDPYDRSFQRKFQELALSIRVEQTYSKDQIIELYMNEVFLGNGVYGLGTAADFYFHRRPAKLTLAQSALLAGLIRAPSYYDPLTRPGKSLLRRNDVLNRMMALGWISTEDGEAAKAEPIGIAKGAGELRLARRPFFVDYLIDRIIADTDLEFTELGQNERQRRRALFEGGLRIVTTLDPKWQAAAQRAANRPWAVYAAHPDSQEPEVAIVSVDNASGAIRTMLSGRDYAKDAKDFVTTGHQPGSSYKPYILATAFQEGIPPTQVYDSTSPARFPGVNADGSVWVVDNAEGAGSHGLMDLYTATTHSVNVVFARLIMDVDPTKVDDVTEAMTDLTRTKNGDRDIPGFASQATGSIEMSPLEMASGFQTIANDGKHCVPYAIQSISRGDDLIYKHEAKCKQTIEPDIAHLITSMLRSVVTSGTAASALAGFGPWVVAGKTGTAQLNTNVWFVGYSAQVSTSVWVGYPGDPEPLQDYFGTSVFGGTVAAPIWRAYMGQILGGLPVRGFPSPPAPKTAPLPSVIGMPKGEAIQTLADAGFRAYVTMVDALAPKGEIVSQTPAGGQVPVGTLVRLGASTGIPPEIVVPDVVGLLAGQATKKLETAGFVVKIVEQETPVPEEVGRVLSQWPRAGRKKPAGTTITLTIGVAPL